jgi:hypothetical protein
MHVISALPQEAEAGELRSVWATLGVQDKPELHDPVSRIITKMF